MKQEAEVREIATFGPEGVAWSAGLLGATALRPEDLTNARLLEIERRILLIEAALNPQSQEKASERRPIDGFIRMHFESCDYFTSRGDKPCTMDCCS